MRTLTPNTADRRRTSRRGLGPAIRARFGPRDDQSGAVLVLALVVLVITSGVVIPLMGLVLNDLHNSVNFTSARSLQADATAATNTAIQSIRYTPLLNTGETLLASPPSYCWGTTAPSELADVNDSGKMDVWCSTTWSPTSAQTRVVTLSTCPVAAGETATTCAANPFLQAVVTFDDYPSGISAPTTGQCLAYCGNEMTIDSWVFGPTAPVVSLISPSSGTIAGNQLITIDGTGFVPGTTVNFVEESGGVPSNNNIVLPGTNVTVTSSTQLTVDTPVTGVITGSTYFVTVTTPAGTSPYTYTSGGVGQLQYFTFTSFRPTMTAMTPNQGTSSGGTLIAITGTGFVNGATVTFAPTGDSGTTATAHDVTVTTDSNLTAVSPAIDAGTTYAVTVKTPSGTTAASETFTYTPSFPTVSSISPATMSLSSPSTVTLNGTGFFSGATVDFVPDSGGNPGTNIPATNVAVLNSGTEITCTPPTSLTAGTYFITVTTTTGTSDTGPTITYS